MRSARVLSLGIDCEQDVARALGALWLAALWFFFALPDTAQADGDITLPQGRNFSLFSSPNCRRLSQVDLDLILDCDFRGKKAQFYLKELPRLEAIGRVDQDWQPFLDAALRSVTDNITSPELADRTRVKNTGGRFSSDGTVLNAAGFQYKDAAEAKRQSKAFERRVLFHAYFIEGLGTGVLVVFSDFDLEVTPDAKFPQVTHTRVKIPEEVMTMLRGFGPAHERVFVP